ncbi:hypothetical protein C7455_1012 [Roseicyclus mahoneyensis]|uniref:Uncharacterized protein n=2 Tax=Roseicyclus mahoneyensis TaxID=164332 RepID=A0A316GLC5_9RHOB|nr:hypothetical protein C7455_1012 [Roseicyclus mahoneyensis]
MPVPQWAWRDSVHVARAAWPELRGNGGHGLARLKKHLGLTFEHHDAGEDARAAAEVVLRAEGVQPGAAQGLVQANGNPNSDAEDFDVIDDSEDMAIAVREVGAAPMPSTHAPPQHVSRYLGMVEITQGNIDHNHIYLRSFFEKFPADAIGGSNRASAALREIAVDWGGDAIVMTDLDGAKRFFRKRGWIREFFERTGAKAGESVLVEQTGPYSYRVSMSRGAR